MTITWPFNLDISRYDIQGLHLGRTMSTSQIRNSTQTRAIW